VEHAHNLTKRAERKIDRTVFGEPGHENVATVYVGTSISSGASTPGLLAYLSGVAKIL